MLPQMVQFGIATEDDAVVETFAARLRTEVVAQASVIMLPTLVGAWARTSTVLFDRQRR